MNKRIDDDNNFSGEEKIQFIKSLVNEELDVKLNNIIAEGIGCQWNHDNSKGMNSFKNEIIKTNSKNVGIIMTYPHPNTIDKKKIFALTPNGLVDSLLKDKNIPITHINRATELNSKVINNMVKSIHISDVLNQDIGRVSGYRNTENVEKIFIVLPISLLEYITEVNYLTPNIFSYTKMFNSIDLQRKFPKEWEFLQKVQQLNGKHNNDNNTPEITKWLNQKKEYVKKHIEKKTNSAVRQVTFNTIESVKEAIENISIISKRHIHHCLSSLEGWTAESGGVLHFLKVCLGKIFINILKDYSKGYGWDEILENS